MRARVVMLDLNSQKKRKREAMTLRISDEINPAVLAINVSDKLHVESRCVEAISHQTLKCSGRNFSEALRLVSEPVQLAFGEWDKRDRVGLIVAMLCLGQIADMSVQV